MSSKVEPYWTSKMAYNLLGRDQNEFIVSDTIRPPFTPIMLYFRGMEKTGSESKTKGGTNSFHYEFSRLTDGIKCATQGCKCIALYSKEKQKTQTFPHFSVTVSVHGIFSTNGIFVWWPKVDNATSYLIQFKSDEPTPFTNVVGTNRTIDEFVTWKDIGDLNPTQVTTNIHPYHEDADDASSTQSTSNANKTISIIELRVQGNVSGILIPNKSEIIVRILVPIIDEDGELIQDMKYVEWKKVRTFF